MGYEIETLSRAAYEPRKRYNIFTPQDSLQNWRRRNGSYLLAQDTKLDRKVALKILPSELAKDADRMGRFAMSLVFQLPLALASGQQLLSILGFSGTFCLG